MNSGQRLKLSNKTELCFIAMMNLVEELASRIILNPDISMVDFRDFFRTVGWIKIKSYIFVSSGDEGDNLIISWVMGYTGDSKFPYHSMLGTCDCLVKDALITNNPTEKGPFRFKAAKFTDLINFLEKFTLYKENKNFKYILKFKELRDKCLALRSSRAYPTQDNELDTVDVGWDEISPNLEEYENTLEEIVLLRKKLLEIDYSQLETQDPDYQGGSVLYDSRIPN